MNLNGYMLGVVVLAILIISLLVWWFIERRRNEEQPQDRTQVINYMSTYAHGHNKGVLNRMIENADWVAVEFFPRDIDYQKMLKENKNVILEPEVVFVPKLNIKHIGKGSWSNHVNDLEIIPIKVSDIPSGLDEDKREYIVNLIEKKQRKRHTEDIFEGWKETNQILAKATSGGGLIRNFAESQGEINKTFIKLLKDGKTIKESAEDK